MQAYPTKSDILTGSSYSEVYKKVSVIYLEIRKRTKRKPYVRAVYFNKEKVFFELFWKHLFEKSNWKDRIRRLKYFKAAIELIEKSRNNPTTKENPNKKSELLHRFAGLTKNKEIFFVQIKENKVNGRKYLMSIFPLDK